MRKRIPALLLALVLLVSVFSVSASAATRLPTDLYLTQETNATCTLSSSAMLLRSRLYLSGSSHWRNVTESGIRSTAWIEGTGLRWNWTYYIGGSALTVKHADLYGTTVSYLKSVLDAHPEGIVLYCGKVPHAVFLTDYEGDTFYCADPAPRTGLVGRIPLAKSYPGTKYGGSQANVLANVTAYWYISNYYVPGDTGTTPDPTPTEPTGPSDPGTAECGCSDTYAGVYKCTTTTTSLLIRSGHGTDHSFLGYSIPPGAQVTVSRASGTTWDDWAHVNYNGIEGFASMQYLMKVGELAQLDDVTMTSAVGHSTGIIVSWEAVENAALYQVYRMVSGGTQWELLKNTGSLSYKDTSAEPGERYYYKVRARNGEQMSSLNIDPVTAVRPKVTLSNVTMDKAIGHNTGNLVYWNAVEGAVLYQVYRRQVDETSWTLLKNTGSTGYKDTLAPVGVRCYYKVVARNGDVKSGLDIAAVSAVRQPPKSLDDVKMTGATGHISGNIIYWDPVGGANLYQVYRLHSGSTTWELLINTGATAHKDTTAETGVRYYYKVVARYGSLKSSMSIDSVSAVRPQ